MSGASGSTRSVRLMEELMGVHDALRADRFEAITTVQQATRQAFGMRGPGHRGRRKAAQQQQESIPAPPSRVPPKGTAASSGNGGH